MHGLVLGALGLSLASPHGAPAAPRDPDDAPFMPAPAGQPRPSAHRWMRFDTPGDDRRPRFQLTLEPFYAAFRAPFLGRSPVDLLHGGGVGLMADLALPWAFGVRVRTSYSGHPAPASFEIREGTPVLVAPEGTIHNVEVAGALLYALDLGRVYPVLELGLGGLWIHTPSGVQPGQREQPCTAQNQCDIGLSCAADLVCRPTARVTLHFGLAVDVAVHRRWSIGAGFRYFAWISAPGTFPIYLQASIRATARF